MKWSQITEVGLVRPGNEDSLLISPDLGFFMLADGMGGHNAGEVASQQALKYLEQKVRMLLPKADDVGKMLVEALQETNAFLYQMACQDSELEGMGTTVTACLVQNNEALIVHVGDSRAYLLKGDSITQITQDHSLVGELVKNGDISEELAQVHPRRNVLTQAVGVFPEVSADLYRLQLQRGDLILLCTDGLTNHLNRLQIQNIVSDASSLEQAVRNLTAAALEQGGTDNISIILIEV